MGLLGRSEHRHGDLYKNGGVNDSYTATFAGTSSSNPIIAGVVASLSGIAKANGITVTPRRCVRFWRRPERRWPTEIRQKWHST
jgi:hypothetical protein